MAEGRMLKKEISDSKKLGELSSDKPRVLYFMMLPHLDIKGRLKADPQKIKGQICTMLPYSVKSIQSALEALHKVGLILLYHNNEAQFLEYTRFGDFQKLYPDKEAESKIPAPTPEDYGELQRTPLKVKGKEVKEKELKPKDNTIVFDKWNSFKNVKKWKSHPKLLYETEQSIDEQLKRYSIDDLCAAVGNYAAVLNSPDHAVFNVGERSWDKHWTLREFLTRGTKTDRSEKYLYRFLPTNFHLSDFLTQKAKNRRISEAKARQAAKEQREAEEQAVERSPTPTEQYSTMPIAELRQLYNDPETNRFLKTLIKKARPEVTERQ